MGTAGSAAGEDLSSLEQLSLLSPAGFGVSGVTKNRTTFPKIIPLSAAWAQDRSLLEEEGAARPGACLVLPQLRQDFHSLL